MKGMNRNSQADETKQTAQKPVDIGILHKSHDIGCNTQWQLNGCILDNGERHVIAIAQIGVDIDNDNINEIERRQSYTSSKESPLGIAHDNEDYQQHIVYSLNHKIGQRVATR